jgi:hypothetical protein
MQATITVEAKVVGRRKPVLTGWSIPFPPVVEDSAAPILLCELISCIVLEEVDAFRKRQEERRLVQVLSPEQIQLGVDKGKVDMGGRDIDQDVNPQAAVATALQAFEDGLYFVFVDGEQHLELDRPVRLSPDSQVTFIRLVPLAGG